MAFLTRRVISPSPYCREAEGPGQYRTMLYEEGVRQRERKESEYQALVGFAPVKYVPAK